MGEISEALRRARRGGAAGGAAPPEPETLPEPAPRRAPAPTAAPPAPDVWAPESTGAAGGSADEPGRDPRAVLNADKSGRWFPRAVVADAHGVVAESFRQIALRLRRDLEARHAHGLAVVSALREEGKTTIACNLALAFATLAQGRSVALVDLDLRKPSVAKALDVRCRAGIEDVLRGERSLRDVCIAIEKPALDVYAVRRPEAEAHELLVRPELEVLFRELTRRYAVVVVDTPPVLLVPDATVILERVDAAVAVARAGRTARRGFEYMLELLPPGRVIGSLLNEGAPPARPKQYGYYADDGTGEDAPDDQPEGR